MYVVCKLVYLAQTFVQCLGRDVMRVRGYMVLRSAMLALSQPLPALELSELSCCYA